MCECPAEHRSGDLDDRYTLRWLSRTGWQYGRYEVGASQAFEEVIEGDVVHNDPGRLQLTQQPGRQRYDIRRWIHDLGGHGTLFLEMPPTGQVHIWLHQQILLFFLPKQMNHGDADAASRAFLQ